MNVPDDSNFITHYHLNHPTYAKVPTFRYYDCPLMGLGPQGKEFIELDSYIDTSNFHKIYKELKSNLIHINPHTKKLVVNGVVPKEYNSGIKSIDSYLLNQSKYLNFDYSKDIGNLTTLSQIKSYFYKKFKIIEPWQGICHMREFTTYAYKNKQSKWLPHAYNFPELIKFVETLPFKILGYALFFISNGNRQDQVYIHRDIFHKSHHSSNFINILFDQKTRPFFLFDGVTKEKKYLNSQSSIYTFNESDLHGVDADDEPRYMLRVEGIFSDDFARKIGFKKYDDYYESFDWQYDKPQQFLKSKNFHIWQETDI